MKVIRVEGTPIGFDDYEPDELEQDELDIIERMGADEIRYCYAINEDFGDYDGAGDALIRINGFWRYASLRPVRSMAQRTTWRCSVSNRRSKDCWRRSRPICGTHCNRWQTPHRP